MTDYSKAALGYQNAVSEMSAGNDQVATGDMTTANKAEDAGNSKAGAATADINAYGGG
jgi:hypothetical protein